MAPGSTRFVAFTVLAFVSANAVAATLLFIFVRDDIDPPMLSSLHDYGPSLHSLGFIIFIFVITSVTSFVPAIAIMILARRFKWYRPTPYLVFGLGFGPAMLLLLKIAIQMNSPDVMLIVPFFVYVVVAFIGTLASFVFWLIVRNVLPWRPRLSADRPV
jgi:hypothetical protein